tara:strand:- start:1371 stop:2627 length:1257 start_codon:yes stop_codon:yes gene_type:complete
MASIRYNNKFNRSPRRNQVERVGAKREIPRIRQVRRRPTTPILQPIFSRFGGGDIVENNDVDQVTAALWSNQDGVLQSSEYFTSSIQSQSSGEYYADIYRETATSNPDREVQFSIAYGHNRGSGSQVPQYASVGFSPSKAIYSQYSNLLLAPGDDNFTLSNRSGSLPADLESFHAINIQRTRLKEKLDPANWELHIGGQGGTNINHPAGTLNPAGTLFPQYNENIANTSSKMHLIDDSSVSDGTVGEGGSVYKIVSGTIADGVHGTTPYPEYGLVYPDNGVMILDSEGINGRIAIFQNTSSFAYCATPVTMSNNNPWAMFQAISGSSYFAARNKETVHATHYFVRVRNNEYNFSNNPTFTSGSNGTFTHASFFKNPKAYITTVGMYNNNNELLAVAKLSKPLLKSFNREALIRIKLEY